MGTRRSDTAIFTMSKFVVVFILSSRYTTMAIKVFAIRDITNSRQYASVLQTLAARGSSVMIHWMVSSFTPVVLFAIIAILFDFLEPANRMDVRSAVENLK